MRKILFTGGMILSIWGLTLPCWAVDPPKPTPETPETAATKAADQAAKAAYYTARVKQIGDQLHSTDKSENQQGLTGIKEWIASDPKNGAKALLSRLVRTMLD